jgi:hypothetical protein
MITQMEDCCTLLPIRVKEKNQQQQKQQIRPKLSTIFREKITDIPQASGSFFNSDGEKYCAVSALSKYLGYDIAEAVVSNKIQNDKNINPGELIPYDILEMIENFTVYNNPKNYLRCFCSRPDYYYRSLISLLIHLNDYHKMTFTQIGNWLESKGM